MSGIPIFVEFLGNLTGLEASLAKADGQLKAASASGAASMQKMGMLGKAAVLGVAAGIGEIAVHSVEAASKFQSSMELLHTQAGVSQKQVDALSKSVLDLAPKVGTGPDELATALYHIESTLSKTLPAAQAYALAMREVKVAAEGAKIGNANLEDVTNALNAAVASGIPGVENLDQAMGMMIATVGAGDMRMQDLAEAFGTGVLANVKGFGVTLNDVSAALATFGDNNIRGADAATQLRMAVDFLVQPTSAGAQVLAKFGITAGELARDMQQGGLNKAITDLRDKLQAAGVKGDEVGQILLDAFGKKAGTGLSILIGQYGRFESKVEETKAGAKGFGDAWGTTTKTVAFQADAAKTNVESLAIGMGNTLLPAAKGVLDVFNGLAGVVENNGSAVKTLAEVVAGAGGLYAAWKLAGGAVSLAETAFRGAASAIGTTTAAAQLLRTEGVGAFQAFGTKARFAAAETEAAAGSMTAAEAGATAGVTLLVGGLVTWAMHSEKAKQEVHDLAQTLDQQTGAVTKNTASWLANKMQQDGVFDAARKVGLDVGTVTQAILGNKAALDTIKASEARFTESGAGLQTMLGSMGDITDPDVVAAWQKIDAAVGDTTNNLHKAAANTRDAAAATAAGQHVIDGAAGSTQNLAAKTGALAGDLYSAANATSTLKRWIDALGQTNIDAATAQIGLQQAIADATAAIKSNGHTLDITTQKGRDNKTQLIALRDAAKQVDDSMVGAHKSIADMLPTLQKSYGDFVTMAERMGLPKKAAEEMARKFGLLPGDIVNSLNSAAGKSKGPAKNLADNVKSPLTPLQAWANGIGQNLDDGLAQGIYAHTGISLAAAEALANKVHITVAQALRVQSPSRVMMDIGINVSEGLAEGIRKGGKDAVDAISQLADNVTSQMTDAVDKARQQLIDLHSQATGYRSGLIGTISGQASVLSAQGATVNGVQMPLTAASLTSFLGDKLAALQAFTTDIGVMRKLGLNGALLSQLINAGPEGALPVLQALMGTSAAQTAANIKGVNVEQSQIDKLAGQFGSQQANAQFGEQIAVSKQQLAALQRIEKRPSIGNLNITITGAGKDARKIAQEVINEINAQAKRGGHPLVLGAVAS